MWGKKQLRPVEISAAAFEHVAQALRDAGVEHDYLEGGAIDMTGIALMPEPAPAQPVHRPISTAPATVRKLNNKAPGAIS